MKLAFAALLLLAALPLAPAAAPRRLLGAVSGGAAAARAPREVAAAAMHTDAAAPLTVGAVAAAMVDPARDPAAAQGRAVADASSYLCDWDGERCSSSPGAGRGSSLAHSRARP
jgi:hypothetical protein